LIGIFNKGAHMSTRNGGNKAKIVIGAIIAAALALAMPLLGVALIVFGVSFAVVYAALTVADRRKRRREKTVIMRLSKPLARFADAGDETALQLVRDLNSLEELVARNGGDVKSLDREFHDSIAGAVELLDAKAGLAGMNQLPPDIVDADLGRIANTMRSLDAAIRDRIHTESVTWSRSIAESASRLEATQGELVGVHAVHADDDTVAMPPMPDPIDMADTTVAAPYADGDKTREAL
jgi:hypothetical protein